MLTILLVISSTCVPTLATSYTLGVQAGNTADYTASLSANATVARMHLLVQNVTGTTAGLNTTYYFSNGTVSENTFGSVDVSAGSFLGFLFLIAKNLNQSDPIYSGATITLNASTTMNVAGADRTVNTLSVAGALFIYWDKATGIMVKLAFNSSGWFNMTMTSTNMWSGGLFGLSTETLLIIGVVGVVVIIAAAVLLMRRRK